MGTCKAYITLDSPKDLYSCQDVIKGKLVVAQSKNLSVKEIVVKLKGKAKVTIGEGEYRSVLMTTLFHDEKRVFPSPELASKSGMDRYTLPEGKYTYPFEFKLPSQGMLLPTFALDFNRIFVRYYVKATIRRSSRLAVNTRTEYDIRTSPCVDLQLLDNHSLESVHAQLSLISGFETLKARLGDTTSDTAVLYIDFKYPQRGIKPSAHETIDLRLYITKAHISTPIILASINVYLLRHGLYKTDIAEAKTLEKIQIEHLEPMHHIDFEQDTADLSELLFNTRLKAACLPSFVSKQIDIQYEIGICLTFSTERGKRKIDITGSTEILPICVHRHSDDDGNALPTYEEHDHPPEY